MRFLNTLVNDMRYQIKYGFYFLYAFISAIYVAVLLIIPAEYKRTAASIIILTDPAMLGMFFIGGIWLLEREEGLHRFWGISPLQPMEYSISKALSLSIISTLSANLIVLIGFRETVNYLLLTFSVFTGSLIFTIIGLTIASYARSINHYMLIASPPATLLSMPPIITAFGISHSVLEIMPGTALLRNIYAAFGASNDSIWTWVILAVWLGIALALANLRMPIALQIDGGGKA